MKNRYSWFKWKKLWKWDLPRERKRSIIPFFDWKDCAGEILYRRMMLERFRLVPVGQFKAELYKDER